MLTILLTTFTLLHHLSPASAQCDRTFLNDLSSLYLAAQTQGLPSLIPTLTPTSLLYTEQFHSVPSNTSILSTPLTITSSRRFVDAELCTSFTQSIVLSTSHPYVIGTRMTGDADGLFITNIDTLVTDKGDWGFDAQGYEAVEGSEEWGAIDEGMRDGREVLRSAADKYLDWLGDRGVSVPFAEGCKKLVGGAWEGDCGKVQGGGEVRVESVGRRYVIDEEVGVVNIFVGIHGLDRNSSESTPDSHTFRIEGGKIRYIHTLSTCEGHPGCGRNVTSDNGVDII